MKHFTLLCLLSVLVFPIFSAGVDLEAEDEAILTMDQNVKSKKQKQKQKQKQKNKGKDKKSNSHHHGHGHHHHGHHSNKTDTTSSVGFEGSVTSADILLFFGNQGLKYDGKDGIEAANQVRSDLIDAIHMKPDVFGKFCTEWGEEGSKREAAAFFSHVKKATRGLQELDDWSGLESDTYCKSGAETYKCFPKQTYHPRGVFKLSWNTNYGVLSKFLYGDSTKLLEEPSKVVDDKAAMWAAALWYWMSPQAYGGKCPPKIEDSFLKEGEHSPHDAFSPNGDGMGLSIAIIAGDYECCPTAATRGSPVERMEDYLKNCNLLKVFPRPECESSENCDIGQGCPLIVENISAGCPLQCTCAAQDVWISTSWDDKQKVSFSNYRCESDCDGTGEQKTEPCDFVTDQESQMKDITKFNGKEAKKKMGKPCFSWKSEDDSIDVMFCAKNCPHKDCEYDACVCNDAVPGQGANEKQGRNSEKNDESDDSDFL